ncbi:MAG: LegC family aminotransferase [Planctomycetes bacterium]|nr:LegC family aminotransferase [Planctomycetota bacterium]
MTSNPVGDGFIPLSVPCFAGNEWEYVKKCLDTNWVSSAGPFVERFEREMATAVGSKYAIAVVNGTAALHIALILAGVEPGDEVVVSDLTFIAPANAIRYLGANPVFIDAEPMYWQMDVQKLRDFLEKTCEFSVRGLRNKTTGRMVRAILPVHILGSICDMNPILELADKFGIPVIEDATECLGARYGKRSAGSLGKIGCFSFNGNKILTTGGGGMIVTDDENIARRARYLTTQAKDDSVEFIHRAVGYNYRLPNILAALGCAQLENLQAFIVQKRKIAASYTKELADLPGIIPMREPPGTFSTFWLYTIRIESAVSKVHSRDLMRILETKGIQTRPLWQPMHVSPAQRGAFSTECSNAECLNRECLSLPCSVGLLEKDQSWVIEMIHHFLI